MKTSYDLIVVGSGASGLTASIHAAFEGLDVVCIESSQFGGQASTTSDIQNYPGFEHVNGYHLMRLFQDQAKHLGVTFIQGKATRLFNELPSIILDDGTQLSAKNVVIATGLSFRHYPLPNIDQFLGKGLHYGPDARLASHYWLDHVVVVGGANSAGQCALNLARYAKNVTILTRHGSLDVTMSHKLIEELYAHDNVVVCPDCSLKACESDKNGRLHSIDIVNENTSEVTTMTTKGVFICIGQYPTTSWLPTEIVGTSGYVMVDSNYQTAIPHVYAIGDVASPQGNHRIAIAVGTGAQVIKNIVQGGN